MMQLSELDAVAGTAGPWPIRWFQPDFFMLRVAGLPVESVAPLQSPRSLAWADGVLHLEGLLLSAKQQVVDDLEAAVAGPADPRLRRGLLDLRRDVFNLRLPRNAQDPAALRDVLGGAALRRLSEWLTLRGRLESELARGEAVVAGELRESRRSLRELAADPVLRNGILLASPSLDRYLASYLDAADQPLSKRARRIERSLLEYVYRTACKTSPFSTLTTVALGRFSSRQGPLLSVAGFSRGHLSHTRLNLVVLGRIADIITSEPALLADMPVQVTSGWRADPRGIRYIRRHRRPGEDDSAVSIDVLEEDLFYLTTGRLLDELLATVAPGTACRFGELAERLSGRDPGQRGLADVQAYLRQLLRLGLLTVPALRVDIHHSDPVRRFAEGIAALPASWARDLAGRLSQVADQVGSYRAAPLAGRRRLLETIRAELSQAQHGLGRAEAALPRTLVYEDVTLGAATVTADARQWDRGIRRALQGLSRILPAFDMTLPTRLLVKGFFRARYGRGSRFNDVISFVHDFQQDCYEQYLMVIANYRPFGEDNEYIRQQNWFRMPEVDALDNARVEFVRRMREAYATLPPGAPELVLGDDFIEAVAAELPGNLGPVEPRSFFLQVASDGPRQLGVLNRAYSGLTLLFSRFAYCLPGRGGADGASDAMPGDSLAGELRATVQRLQPDGAVFAELTGGYDTANLNLHPAVLPYELVCPGDMSFRPEAEQIPVDDLVIADDEDTDQLRLVSRRLGVTVIPVYLGFLMPMALPEVQRILLAFSYTNMAMPDVWGGVNRRREAGLVTLPRVRHRDLVLSRRTWKASRADLPARTAGATDAQWFLDWTRWSRRHGLPRQVFLSRDADAAAAGEDDDSQAGVPLTKPQYVDFDSYFSLTLLDHVLSGPVTGLNLTEMLPGHDQLWLRTGRGRYVTELTVELDGIRSRELPGGRSAA